MASTSAPGLSAMPGGSDLVEYLRAQRAARGIVTPADVNAAASTNAGVPSSLVQSEAPSGGIFGSAAPAEAGEGASALSALSGFVPALLKGAAKVAGPLYAGYSIAKPYADQWNQKQAQMQDVIDGKSQPDPNGRLPDMADIPRQNATNPVVAQHLALAALSGQPVGPTSQPSPDSPSSAGPVAAGTDSGPPAGQTASAPSGASSSPADTAAGTAQPAPQPSSPPQGVTMDMLMQAIASSSDPKTAWKPNPVQASPQSTADFANVTKANAPDVVLDKDGNAPGVSGFQRFLAAGAGPFDWHRADEQAIARGRMQNGMSERQKMIGSVSGGDLAATNQANVELQKASSEAGGISPQTKAILDIMGGSLSAGQGMRAKLAEIQETGNQKVRELGMNPDYLKIASPDISGLASQRANMSDLIKTHPDALSAEDLAKAVGITPGSNPSADLETIRANLNSINAARGFSPEKIQEAQMFAAMLPGIMKRLGQTSGIAAPGSHVTDKPATGGPAPASGGRPSNNENLNLSALKH